VTLKGRVPGELYEVLAAYAGLLPRGARRGDRPVAASSPNAPWIRGRRPWVPRM